ncbi:uncharacterized protein LOC118762906 [Octopus sinensis]|uniref:Uncharacterized protein LOC118762906 n=1 Tax=Octopus sinensis TaxID=2607531 RepID=A0A7E6ER68_9MOLL|nr:uncharacterized protein LOC118762906 [Octopus sinensis]
MELQCTRLKSVVIQNSHTKSEKQKPPKRTNRHQSKSDYTASKRRDSSTPSREQTHTWHRSFVPRSSDNQCYPRKKNYQNLSKSKNSRGSKHSEEERRSNYPSTSHDYESSKSAESIQDSPQKRQASTKKPSFHESRSRERENFTSYNTPSWEWNHTIDGYPTYQQNFCDYDKNLWPNEYPVPNVEFYLPLNYDQSQNPPMPPQSTHETTSCYFPNQALSIPEEPHYAIREPSDEVFNEGFYNYDFPYSFLNFRDNKSWINPPIENKVIPCTGYSNFPVNSFFNPPGGFLQDSTSGMNFHSDSVHYMFPQVPQFCDSYIPVRQHIIPSIPKSTKKAPKDNSNEFDEALKRIMMEQFSLFTNFTPQFSTWCLECCGWDYGKAADSFIYNSHIVKRIPYMAYNA